MNKCYVLTDPDNRDGDGSTWEITSPTLAGFVGYVDGPLRDDLTNDGAKGVADEAIDALRRENFSTAKNLLHELGVYIHLEVEEDE